MFVLGLWPVDLLNLIAISKLLFNNQIYTVVKEHFTYIKLTIIKKFKRMQSKE